MIKQNTDHDFVDDFDMGVQVLCTQISENYLGFLSRGILPDISDAPPIKIRELRVLMSIFLFEAGATPTQIAKILSSDPATVTRAVARLMELGLIDKNDNREDTRSAWISLTDQGRAAAQRYQAAMREKIANYDAVTTHPLSREEKAILLKALLKIRARSLDVITRTKNAPL